MTTYKDLAASYLGCMVSVIISVFSGVHIDNIVAVVTYSVIGGTVSLGMKRVPHYWKHLKAWWKSRKKRNSK